MTKPDHSLAEEVPMKNHPTMYTLSELMRLASGSSQAGLPDGRWVPARPRGSSIRGSRLRIAWEVFCGRADAVKWPGQ